MPKDPIQRFKRIVVVSYRLPFKTVMKDGKKTFVQNTGGLVSAMSALSAKMADSDALYRQIVWAGKSDEQPEPPRKTGQGLFRSAFNTVIGKSKILRDTAERLSAVSEKSPLGYQLVPVTIDPEVDKKYYGGFCNDLIWPLFHYFPSLVVHDESYFENYLLANRQFAEALKNVLQPDDFIWIHDYHLFLLPGLIREYVPNANIGFFLHIPFPAFEVFRNMPRRWSTALLNGMLGADLIGFHTYDYCQYFLRTVSKLLGHEVTMNSVNAEGRMVRVDAFPIGIDYEKFNNAAAGSKEVEREKVRIREMLHDKKLIFSVDRLDYSKGLLQRLEGFECFLETYPEWIEKIVFNMVVIPSRDSITRYQEMKREIEAAVGRINGKFSTMAWRPLVYQYKSIPFEEMVALYDLSLVGLITPIRDGMNLVAKEYVACQIAEKGVLILSEMAGAAAELTEALLINPADKKEVAEALNRALVMPLRERNVRLLRMQKRIKNYTVFTWANEIIESLDAVKREQEQRKVNIVTPAHEINILTQFVNAQKRVVFLDYDGTLVPFSKVPELAVPSVKTLDRLKSLAENPKNTIVLISGRDKNFMEEWFGTLNVHCIAEHGAFYKAPQSEWACNIDADQTWKTLFLPVLQRYTDRCNGSFIEEKFSSLAWHFRNAPTERGTQRAIELKEELRALVAHENKLQVIDGNMVVEIKRTGYDKGIAALKFISDKKFDCMIALGDDKTDEDIFKSLPSTAISIKIGMTTSIARYNLPNQHEVSRFLDRLINVQPS